MGIKNNRCGSFEKHIHQEKIRKSDGKVVDKKEIKTLIYSKVKYFS